MFSVAVLDPKSLPPENFVEFDSTTSTELSKQSLVEP